MRNQKYKLIGQITLLLGFFLFLTAVQVIASSTTTMSQTISGTSKSVDIVNASGTAVGSPAITFGAIDYSFSTQDATGTLGVSAQRIRAYNPTSATTFTVSIAGVGGTAAVWTDGGSLTYDFNDGSGYTDGADATDTVGGQLTIDADNASVTLEGVSPCSADNASKGTEASFVQGTTDSIDLITTSANATNTYCRWDYYGAPMTQKIPAGQAGGTYTLSLILSIT